jgi:2-polyprenyl-3-methyl-5-hydroxy-6-metoxy-1,4-benzoquinol methylase
MPKVHKYIGNALESFSAAVNWKSYLRRQIRPYLGRDVLEVGAGIGGTTQQLCDQGDGRWICLEPDPELAGTLVTKRAGGEISARCQVEVGTIETMRERGPFDSILYIDVLEHIEDDAGEVRNAAELLGPGGHLVVLSPAHPWLFTPFDRAIGHYRRYTRRSLLGLTPSALQVVCARYLDSAGLLASLGNRVLLKSPMPTPGQIAVWDRCLVPVSTFLDTMTGFHVGKSILAVWRR